MIDSHGRGAPPRGNEEAHAPIPRFASVDGFIPRGDETHYAHLDSFNQFHPAYNNNIGDGPGAWALSGLSGTSSRNTAISSSSKSKPGETSSAWQPTIIIIYVNSYNAYFESYSPPPPSSQPFLARATASPAFSSNQPQLIKSSVDHTPKIQKGSGLYLANFTSAAAAAAAIPSAAQIIARYADRSLFVPTSAFDAALQSYSPPRVLAANNATADRAYSAATSANAVLSDNSFDDFIELTKSSSAQTTDSISDDSSIEFDAVSEVLDHLQELNLAPWRTSGLDAQIVKDASHDSGPQDTPWALALADFALANAEGGMVMLDLNDGQSTDVDFSNIAVSEATSPVTHLNLDSAVGFHQVVEVAGEEAAGVIAATFDAPVQSLEQTRTENRLPIQSQRATKEKAAVVVGASALIGAAVWCVQRKQSDDETAKFDASSRRRRVV